MYILSNARVFDMGVWPTRFPTQAACIAEESTRACRTGWRARIVAPASSPGFPSGRPYYIQPKGREGVRVVAAAGEGGGSSVCPFTHSWWPSFRGRVSSPHPPPPFRPAGGSRAALAGPVCATGRPTVHL